MVIKTPRLRQCAKTIRNALWRTAGDKIAYSALFLQGHARAWANRYDLLKGEGLADGTEAVLYLIAAVVGVGMTTLAGKPAIANNVIAYYLDCWVPIHIAGLYPHHVFGVAITFAGLCGLCGVMEWPVTVKRNGAAAIIIPMEIWDKTNLRILLVMRRTASLVAFNYWMLSAILILPAHHHSTLGIVAAGFTGMHMVCYFWAGRQYARGHHASNKATRAAKLAEVRRIAQA